jgi:hypothetical protein
MWLNPLKGAHLTLGQLDKTLPVDKTVVKKIDGVDVEVNKKIERGSIVFITTGGKTGKEPPRFQLYTEDEAAKPNAVPYVALMGINDFQAGMAGSVGQAPEAEGIDKATAAEDEVEAWLRTPPIGTDGIVGVTGGIHGPRITAVSLVQPAEWETTAFDKDKKDDFYVGLPLSVNNEGKLTPWTDGKNIVGYVTKTPDMRWINDLGASVDGARISGGNALVIAYSTAWIPVAATAASGDDDTGNVNPLSLKGAQADAKADAKNGAQVDAKNGAQADAKNGAQADAKGGANAGAKGDNTQTK